MRILPSILICTQALYASHSNIDRYLEYASAPNFGRFGDHTRGEMQIVASYDEILKVQENYRNEFLKKGFSLAESESYSRVGVVAEDKYWIWFRDPLILPNGKTTAYNRFFPKTGLNGTPGIATMAISQGKEILVNVHFRHATREWEIELPRGTRYAKETSAQAALRSLEEETGVVAPQAEKLAAIASDSGILMNVLELFVIRNAQMDLQPHRDECTAIHSCFFLPKERLKQAFVDGFIGMEIQGVKTKVFCRDSFLASAILVGETKGML